MRKPGFTIIEVVVVFLLILGVTFLVLPKSLDNTRQAKLISKWSQKYSALEYMFSVIKAQQDSDIKAKIDKAENNNARKDILLETLKPYLRITSEVQTVYRQSYMNKTEVNAESKYHFNNYYGTSSDEIVGLKWVNADCTDKDVCAILVFDINGVDAPNTWGYDVFGVNIMKNRIEPIGKGIDSGVIKADCNDKGSGIYCSYYYLIGGRFDQ